MILVNASDQHYFQMTKAMVASFFHHNPGSEAALWFLNVDELLKIPNSTITYQRFRPENDEHRRDYIANLRPYILKGLLNGNVDGTEILYLDSDSIVRGPVPSINPHMVATLPRPDAQEEENKFLISTMQFINTPLTRRFVGLWVDVLESMRKGHYSIMTCQLAFKVAYDLFTVKFKEFAFMDCGIRFSDWEFRDDSVIWCARGDRKQDPKYIEEVKKYAALLNHD